MTSNPALPSRAWVDIRLDALALNARTVAAVSGVRLLPMVKANAYGLGAVPVARRLEAVDPWGYGVMTPEEGIELRGAGITRPILVFTPFRAPARDVYQTNDLRPTIGDLEGLRAWLAGPGGPFHLEIDTGMARSGFRWDADRSWVELLSGVAGFEGVFTHFHSAGEEPKSVREQWGRFVALVDSLPARPPLVHAANSAAALDHAETRGSLVRPGIFLYGGKAGRTRGEPVVALRTTVVGLRTVPAGQSVSYSATWTATRPTRVATLCIGYADGVLRSLAGNGAVELGRRIVPILGRITMDFIMVEAPEGTALGDVATVFGGLVALDDQAGRAGTNSYELLTAMGPRVARVYHA